MSEERAETSPDEDGEDYALGALEALVGAPLAAGLRAGLRAELLDLVRAPHPPIDVSAYAWQEVAPGIRLHEMGSDPSRSMRACLVWAQPGAKTAPHRHLGDEVILVLQGGLRDDRGTYRAGQICRSRTGSSHTEEVLPGEDCFCYVVYYGGHELL